MSAFRLLIDNLIGQQFTMTTDAYRDESTGVHNLGVLMSEFYCPAYDSILLYIYLGLFRLLLLRTDVAFRVRWTYLYPEVRAACDKCSLLSTKKRKSFLSACTFSSHHNQEVQLVQLYFLLSFVRETCSVTSTFHGPV
jgi:hypothetical protein